MQFAERFWFCTAMWRMGSGNDEVWTQGLSVGICVWMLGMAMAVSFISNEEIS